MADRKRILVVGDIMIDRYTYVRTDRQAPEAPIPVWDEVRVENRLGGAANVAHNIASLASGSMDVYLAGIVGTDLSFSHMLRAASIQNWSAGGTTMVKNRFVEEGSSRYLLRHDNFRKFPEDDIRFFETLWCTGLKSDFDVVVFSDYDKGTITRRAVESFSNVPIRIVDSKRADMSIYRRSTVIKLNKQEYERQRDVVLGPLAENVVVTEGANGAQLIIYERLTEDEEMHRRYAMHRERFPVDPVPTAVDVTGCGDTHTAAMAYAMALGADVRRAIRFGNAAARHAVQKFGTSVP